MPRKTKEAKEIEKEVASKIKSLIKKASKKADAKVKVAEKKDVKKGSTKLKDTKKATPKTATTKKTTKKKTTTKPKSKTATEKSSPVKSKPTKKVATKKASSKTTKKASKKTDIVEYYDLPYRYNQTIVKVLAQTPTTLFIYWDISDEDRENYKKKYGDNFFETTKPILKIYNDTMNYSFEVEINDFANSWYLHINDAKCDYRVELARRPIYTPDDIGGTDYVYISTSNEIEAPNDRILIDKVQNMVYFRNVKTNQIIGRSFANLSFLRNMGKIYNIYDLYRELYKDEDLEDIYNPSSKFI